jgi:hypothetical protein
LWSGGVDVVYFVGIGLDVLLVLGWLRRAKGVERNEEKNIHL